MNCTVKIEDNEIKQTADVVFDENGTVECPICLTPMNRFVFVEKTKHCYCDGCNTVFESEHVEEIRRMVWGEEAGE